LNGLKEKSKYVIWKKENRKEYFAVFSRKGFTQDLIKEAEKERNVYLFSLKEF